ncbi:hydrogenase maturation protease [Thermococcus sp. AM4]|uniref:hydrogenase maturation protease n=1 Tax=Thermococcus sp. (strain AM4) TaxID=246969 RepID=UPI000187053A|nr:hydrogenase maturation protease [Thermococcus sp. AM4]EEB74864.1 Hydrogenase maturation protease [Thermococcus sp. AM4]
MKRIGLSDVIGNARRVVLWGIGNEKRGDYGFGAYLAEALMIAIRNPNFLVLNCREVPESQAGVTVRFAPELLIIAVPLELGEEPGKLVVAGPWEAIEDVPEEFRPQLEVTLRHVSELLPETRILILGCQPGSEKEVTEPVKTCVRALSISLHELFD